MLKRLPLAVPAVAALVLFSSAAALAATITEIQQPDEDYVASTTQIDISGIEDSTTVHEISDESLTVTFNFGLFKDSGWPWGSDPYVENESPHLLMSDWADALTMTLSRPAAIVGFELRPNTPESHDFTITYRLAGGDSHVIQRQIAGADGARLIAVSIDGDAIEQIHVKATTELGVFNDFAIAQLRYALADGSAVQSETPDDLAAFVVDASDNGTLQGTGPGNAAAGRMGAFTGMLENAQAKLAAGETTAGCNQLRVALSRTDRSPRPPDLVEGDAAAELAALLEDQIAESCD